MRKAQLALFLSWLLSCPVLFGQSSPRIDVGWIMQLAAAKSGSSETPLRVNDGTATFLNRWSLLAEARINHRLSVFLELQSLRGLQMGIYNLSAVYQPAADPSFRVEAGKFLIPFGNFLARHWASENPLFEFPLPYNYRTIISAFQLPRSNADLLSVRGSGHRLHYPTHGAGASTSLKKVAESHLPRPEWGLRVMSRDVYLTGVQVFKISDKIFYAVTVTNGAPSYPVDINNSNGMQVGGRLRFTPATGLDLGLSFSTAPYLDESSVEPELEDVSWSAEDYRQSVVGVDAAYSRGHLVVFAEALYNRWESPFLRENLDLWGGYVEGKYTLKPHWYVAARLSGLIFGDLADPTDIDNDGELRESWDYDVAQVEMGLGYKVNRNALLKAVYQLNHTFDVAGGDPSDNLTAIQAVVFF